MEFKEKLVEGRLVKRYKRFLADVQLDDGRVVTAHCTNSGAMTSCLEDNARVYLTPVNDPKRKTKFTWEMIEIDEQWVGVNTSIPNVLVYDAICQQQIEQLKGYTFVKREVKFGDSRFDVMAQNDNETCYVEVKNVTMKVGEAVLFPDAVTTRGKKHLDTLVEVKKNGHRAVMIYVVQRTDVSGFGIAKTVDPAYYNALKHAVDAGVELIAVQASVSPTEITIINELPFLGF